MLHPHLDEWIKESKRVGMTTSIVSNGTKMSRNWLESMRPYLDWLVSVDASKRSDACGYGTLMASEFKNGVSGHLSALLGHC